MRNKQRTALLLFSVLCLCSWTFGQEKTARPKPPRTVAQSAQSNVRDQAFISKVLGRETRYRILLPKGYDQTTGRYPVLYLLHGALGGYENWETRTDLTNYAANLPLIIVMPDAGNSWYVNSATEPNRMEDFIVDELIPTIDQQWRTIRSPHRRAIAGLSMGGYGALKFAMKYPGMFAVAASISGAISGPSDLENQRPDLKANIEKAFGPAGSPVRAQNDLIALARASQPASTPYLYLDCGSSDFLLDSNRRLVSALSDAKLAYEYHEVAGAHTWSFWDARLPIVLDLVTRKIAPNSAAK